MKQQEILLVAIEKQIKIENIELSIYISTNKYNQ